MWLGIVIFRRQTLEIAGNSLIGQSAAKPSTQRFERSEGSETIMRAPHLSKRGDGIVHSIWKQMVNIKEARDPGAIPGTATSFIFLYGSD